MSAVVDRLTEIDYSYDKTGEVQCRNAKGLIFFLQAEPPSIKGEAKAEARPATPAPTWQPMESVVEVEVRRAAEPMPIAEATRRHVEAPAAAAEVRQPAKTGPLSEAPAPGKQAEKGWFGKLFTK
ncbi:hypothetical protein D3C72_997910 [compost metagenome]